jgi:hypothetical protein
LDLLAKPELPATGRPDHAIDSDGGRTVRHEEGKMPITGIEWKRGQGHDIHLLRGRQRTLLRDTLNFILPDGSRRDAARYLRDNADVELDFQPSFKNTIDEESIPPSRVGFGIRITVETGSIRVDPPTPDPVIHNFLVHAIAVDTNDDEEYSTSIRVHLHDTGSSGLRFDTADPAGRGEP